MDMLVKELKGFFDEKNNKEQVLIDIADFFDTDDSLPSLKGIVDKIEEKKK